MEGKRGLPITVVVKQKTKHVATTQYPETHHPADVRRELASFKERREELDQRLKSLIDENKRLQSKYKELGI